MIVIRGGSVLTPDGWADADVVIEGGIVTDVIDDAAPGSVEIDAVGCLVGPAFVDLHAHLREPGQTCKEDIESGSRAAVAGGYGAIVMMPNTDPPLDTPEAVEIVLARGRDVGLVDVFSSGALTIGRSGERGSDLVALHAAGVRLFSDDGDAVMDSSLLEEIMATTATLPGAVVAQHAEDPTQTAGGHMHEGSVSARLGIGGMPASAESEVVTRDLDLAARTGARYHCQHVSSKETIDVLAAAKKRRLKVTAEVTPHHLTFDEGSVETLDPNFKMYPPLRSAADRAALVEALRRGIIDIVATDHAPHARDEKDVPFGEAPRGVIGLETAASAVWDVLAERDRFFEVMSTTPARIAGLDAHGRPVEPGCPANLVVFDPRASWVPSDFVSKSSNSPYSGREIHGTVRATIHDGEIVYRAGGGG